MKNKQWIDIAKINKKLRTLGSGKYLKLAEGDNKLRILPRTDDSGIFYLELTQHYGFSDGQRKRAYPCLKAMESKPCPVCDFYEAVKEEGGKKNEKLANEVRPSTNYLINVVDRATNQIKILSCSGKMLRGFLNYFADPDYGTDILDPETGNDFTISREGTGFTTRYSDPRISPKQRPIGIEGWESKAIDLEKEIEVISYNELLNALHDNYGDYIEELGLKFKKKKEEDEDDVDEETETKSSKAKGARAGKGRPNDDEDEREATLGSGEEGDEELLEDDEAPVRKQKRASKVEEDEDEFFDEDDEEEVIEEDEKPKKRSKK